VREVCGEHLGSTEKGACNLVCRELTVKLLKIQPILGEHLKQPSLGGRLKNSFLVDEIPHFLNKSADGSDSVTVVGAMPGFGWVGSFLLVGLSNFLLVIS